MHTLADQLRSSFLRLQEVVALLEPEECEKPTMAGGWSPKALLAHVAFWDDVQRERMELALTGSAPAFKSLGGENDARAAADMERDLDEVIAHAEAARARLTSFAESHSPELLARDWPEGERTLRPVLLLEHMVDHVNRHRRDLFAWCGSPARWSRKAFRAFLDHQHGLVLDSVAGLTEEQILSVRTAGAWTLRDELVHILAWSEYGVRVLDGWPQVSPEAIAEFVATPERDEDLVNAGLLAARAQMNMIDIADQLATFHRRTLNRFDRLDDVALASYGDFGWGESGTLNGFLYSLALHQAEHAEALWNARPAPERSLVHG